MKSRACCKARRAPKTIAVSQALASRDRAMLEVFYAGALRVSEIINLKLEDLKLELGYVLVRGKGDKERIVPLGRAAQEIVQEYLRRLRGRCWRWEVVAVSVYRARSTRHHAATGVADGGCRVGAIGSSCQPAHAAAQLRHAYGGERRRPAHGADDSGPRRHFDHAGVHASGAGPAESGVPAASSAR